MEQQVFTKYASMITRGGNRFFDQALAPYGIGCGQQFFLARLAENEGMSMYDLARLGRFDKATVTRAMQKLGESGYITCEVDESDRRYRRLYTTEAARPLLERLRVLGREWQATLTDGLTPEEIALADRLLRRLAQNALGDWKEEGRQHE